MGHGTKIIVIVAALMGGAAVASAHTVQYVGTPTDYNQGA
jgi:hypothetical protein